MAGAVKVKNKHQILVTLDADKLEDFKRAIRNKPIGEFFRQQQSDIVEEYRKNLEAQENPLGLPKPGDRQTTIDQYQINPFRSSIDLDRIKEYLMFNASEEEISHAAFLGAQLVKHTRSARANINRRELIKR